MSAVRDAQFARAIGQEVERIRDLITGEQKMTSTMDLRVSRCISAIEDRLKERMAAIRCGRA